MTIIRTIEGASADFSPQSGIANGGGGRLAVGPDGNLNVRGPVHTDEGSYRYNFSGSNLAISIGTCTFTNGSPTVTGTNFSSYAFRVGDAVKLTSDADVFYTRIESIDSETQITLEVNYGGAGGTGDGSTVVLEPVITSDGSLVFSRGTGIMTTGTISGGVYKLERFVDVLPLTKQCGLSVSQRVTNQEILIGLYDTLHPIPYYYAWFRLLGSHGKNTIVTETGSSRAGIPSIFEIETNTIVLPNTLTTDQALRYRIEINNDKVKFLVNSIIVAEHYKVVMPPYAFLTSTMGAKNTGTVPSATVLTMDYDGVQNYNQVITGVQASADPTLATSGDLETLVDLLNVLISKTPVADPIGRSRNTVDAFGGTAVATGTGAGGAGIPRVTVSSDSSLAANQSVNVAQVNGVTTAVGVGVSASGVIRTVLAADAYQLGNNVSIGATLPILFNTIAVS